MSNFELWPFLTLGFFGAKVCLPLLGGPVWHFEHCCTEPRSLWVIVPKHSLFWFSV